MKSFMYFILAMLPILIGSIAIQSPKQTSADLIFWKKGYNLTWNDFKGQPDSLSTYEAMTFVKMSAKNTVRGANRLEYSITCAFNPVNSWSKDKSSGSLLKHEKLHFDIAELMTRKLRKACSKHLCHDPEITFKFVDSTFNVYCKQELGIYNSEYDSETNHGKIADKQQFWENKIAKELEQLNAYAAYRVIIKIVPKR